VNYWEIIADNLAKPVGVGAVSQLVDSKGRTIFVADAHRGDGKRFVVHADEKLTAFLELESASGVPRARETCTGTDPSLARYLRGVAKIEHRRPKNEPKWH